MTSAEFSVWLQEYRFNPWGEARVGMMLAHIAQVIANYAGKMREKDMDLEYKDAHAYLVFEMERLLRPDDFKEPAMGPMEFAKMLDK
jgi:hypothetical protein